MKKKFYIFGDINNKKNINISEENTIKDILENYADGMSDHKKVKLVQIGGPLGRLIKGPNLNYKLRNYMDHMYMDTIIFLNDLTCPVDFVKFCIRYVIRELEVKSSNIIRLNDLIEGIVSGCSEEDDLDKIKKIVNKETDSHLESRLYQVILFMVDNFKDEFNNHIQNKKCQTGICRKLFTAQCSNACPAEVNVPAYIALMADEKITEAYSLMRRNNPLPFVCGMVCSRPCEDRCRRGEIEKTVGVRALKRYAADRVLKSGEYKEKKLEYNGKKIGIIGAGPAGLSAAYFLAKTGYKVTIYEASKVVGGMLAAGIPEYRLPQEAIEKEVNLIKELEVTIKTNIRIGEDIPLKNLREEYDSILLATGAHIGNKFGVNIESIETAIDLLREVKVEGRKKIGKNVVVIGGGDVAMDAARTSIRLGAENVTVATLEEFEAMPASDEEKHEALEEKIQFINGYGVKDINIESNNLKGVTFRKCISMFNLEGVIDPIYDDKELKALETDNLIFAIGQKPNTSYLDEDIERDSRGWIKIDKSTFETTVSGIFAAGDIYKPGVAIKAIAEAKKAAQAIDKYLGGKGLYLENEPEIPQNQLHHNLWFEDKINERVVNALDRVSNFKEISLTMSDIDAKCEAKRCLRCDRNTRSS